jgi:hypothetical protein
MAAADEDNKDTTKTTGAANNPPPPPTTPPATKEKPKRVEVICEGTLGHLLLKKGDTTGDEEYVALLKTKRGKMLVREIG